ncbi:response regulator [Paenibacillus thalictri]|uniref:Response regulator n=1 Tax=Paenibacillus thalictri TaxID=2527873 RepID=A0A4Q9DTK8_9BACL|nr:response regulator [Paenibacillus thalictri]TBL80273.1 response regulator [Paenibacillus thalictri]
MNVLIVDDEPIVRTGLSSFIEWERHGLRLAGTANDGMDAWERLQREPVDIVVTDILMPRMDGLELVRRLHQASADMAVIVLSCLDDFVYVKQAMKLGARDYVLKPTMEPEELVAILLEAKNALELARHEKEQLAAWRKELEMSKLSQLSMKLEKYISGGHTDDSAIDLPLAEGHMLYSVGVRTAAPQLAYMDWSAQGALAAVRCGEQSVLLLYAGACALSQHQQYTAAYERSSDLERFIRREAGLAAGDYFIGVGEPVRHPRQVAEAVQRFERQQQHAFYAADFTPVGSAAAEPSTAAKLPLEEKIDLLRAVAAGNMEAVRDAAKRIMLAIAAEQPPVTKVHGFIFELFGMAAGYARERGDKSIDEFEARFVNQQRIQALLNLQALGAFMQEALEQLSRPGMDEHAGWNSKNPFIRKVIQYMRANYQQNIGTADIAEHVRLSRSYLSDLFSKEMGESLSEALTRIRMDEAKRLLSGGEKKVYEVAEAVGFQDAKTFAKTFKRVVGCSPKEYESV